MVNFEYTGLSEGKYVSGDIEAVNTQEAEYKLKEQHIDAWDKIFKEMQRLRIP